MAESLFDVVDSIEWDPRIEPGEREYCLRALMTLPTGVIFFSEGKKGIKLGRGSTIIIHPLRPGEFHAIHPPGGSTEHVTNLFSGFTQFNYKDFTYFVYHEPDQSS